MTRDSRNEFLFKNYIKYFLKYLVGFMLILIPCILVLLVSWKTTQEKVLEAGMLRFQNGMTEIETDISKISILENDIYNSDSFRKLAEMQGDIPWGQYMELHYANSQLKEMRYLYEFSPYFFVLFADNDFFVSTQQCDDAFLDGYYDSLMSASADQKELSANEFKALVFQDFSAKYSFVKLDAFSYYTDKYCNIENPILCIVNDSYFHRNGMNCRGVYVLEPETIIRRLLTEECLQDGFVYITDATGNVLLKYGNVDATVQKTSGILDKGEHWIISADNMNETGWMVQCGIPKSVIGKQMAGLYKLIGVYVIMGMLLVFALAYYYGRKQYQKLKDFYSLVPEKEIFEKQALSFRGDEYEPLLQVFGNMADDSMRYQQQRQELENQKYAIRLEKLITGGINSQEERKELKELNIIPTGFFCIAIARMRDNQEVDYSLAVLSLKEYLQSKWQNEVFHIHTGVYDELFIFSLDAEQEPHVGAVKKLFEEAVQLLSESLSIDISVGISTVGTDVANLKQCYTQARYVLDAYYYEFKNTVNCYMIELDSCKETIVDMDFLNQMYHSLIYLNKEGVRKSLWHIRAYCSRQPVVFEMQKEQMFYAIRNTIYNAMLYITKKPESIENLPVFDKADNVDTIIEKLECAAERLIETGNTRKNVEKEEARNSILEYMENRYSDKGLSVNMICEELKISERFLQSAIKEKTGDTFAVYLEKLRVAKAAELLLNTKLSNEQIADQVGFTAVSTYYRVFNKRMGMSPKAFKEV